MEESKGIDIESDNEVLDLEHSKLLSAVRQLDGKQRVKAPTRKETSQQISEFNLGKHQIGNDTVGINELTKALEKRASHVEIGQKLKNLKQKAKPLKPPLEKFEAEKIKRVVGFTNVKQQLNRWNAVVDRNRVAENLIYPLIPKGSITLDTTKDFVKRFESQSELEAKVAEILSRSKVVKQDKEVEKEDEVEEEEFPLSLEEIMERRKEMAKLRAQQSYREAKAARQKKIKSKSYHRTLRRQKIKQQLKDFENLQKTDPEAALKQLEQIEKARAEERMTLRHRNTGKWARSRAVRAKYNEQTRQELAEQLAISRDLTKKIQIEESSSDEAVEEDINVNSTSNTDNPWVNGKTESEVENFLRGYKRFWEQKNAREQQENKGTSTTEKSTLNNIGASSDENKALVQNENQGIITQESPGNVNKEINTEHTFPLKEQNKKHQDSDTKKEITRCSEKVKRKKLSPSKTKKKRKFEFESDDKVGNNTIEFTSSSGNWEVTPLLANGDVVENKIELREAEIPGKKNKNSSLVSINGTSSGESVEELFQKMEEKVRDSVNKRIAKYQKEFLNNSEGVTANNDESDSETPVSLEMKKQVKFPEIDEALSEGATQQSSLPDIAELQKMSEAVSGQQMSKTKTDIDPKKFIAVKAKPLDSELPDVADMEEALDDEGEENERQLTITEAFADDDVVEQFRKEKEEAVKKSEPEDIDLSLPGWGTWGGKGILASVPKKKKKRFIIKFPKPPPRKDSNKGDVIINEEKDDKIKEHQVSEVPFPFTTVKDYEASVRAPIGATWVTQSSHRKLTAPKFKTYLGKIIKPIDEDLLLKKKPVTKKK